MKPSTSLFIFITCEFESLSAAIIALYSGSKPWPLVLTALGRAAVMRVKYNSTAPGYDELYREEQLAKYEVAAPVLEKGENERVCDIGAGTLLLLEYMSERKLLPAYYVAVDVSEGMLEQGRKRLQRLQLGSLADIVQADAQHLPIRGGACRLAASFTVIDLVDEPLLMLAEMDRVAEEVIVSSLKLAHRGRKSLPRYGLRIGETDKDVVFVRRR